MSEDLSKRLNKRCDCLKISLDKPQVLSYIIIKLQEKGGILMRYHKIEVDEKVWNYLKSKAEPFEDTPNSVLNRILFGTVSQYDSTIKLKETGNSDLVLPPGIPKALSQVLEVIYEIKKSNRSRTEATNIVARRRDTAPQTIIDKYCRQLNKKAYEIDELLEEQDLSGFKLLLKNKFTNHKDVIDNFFDSFSGNPSSQYQWLSGENKESEKIIESENIIFVCRNDATRQNFIFVEDASDGKALLVTPEGKIKALDPGLFEEIEEQNKDYLLSHDLITELQIAKYHEFMRNIFPVNNESSSRATSIPIPDRRITEDDLIPHIVEVLQRHQGRAPKEVVDKEMYQKLQNIFEQPWYQEFVSGSTPRWRHHVAWAKERAKHRGFIKWPSQSGHGIWELTETP